MSERKKIYQIVTKTGRIVEGETREPATEYGQEGYQLSYTGRPVRKEGQLTGELEDATIFVVSSEIACTAVIDIYDAPKLEEEDNGLSVVPDAEPEADDGNEETDEPTTA